jgi:hypothetical protein
MRSKYLVMGKSERRSEAPVPGELNPTKNLRIPRRNQEIINGGLGGLYAMSS